jgi:hypothetical protein
MEIVIEKEVESSFFQSVLNQFREHLLADLESPLSVTTRRHSEKFRCGVPVKYRYSNKYLVFTFDDSSRIYINLNWNIENYLYMCNVPKPYHDVIQKLHRRAQSQKNELAG